MFSTSASRYLTSAALLPLRNGPKPQSFNAFQGSWLNPSSEFNQEALLILESTKAQLHDLSHDRKRQSLNTSPGIQCLQPGTGMCGRSGVLLPGPVSISPPEEQDAVPQLATDWGLQKSPALSSGPPGLSCKSTMEQSVGSLQPWKELPLNSSLPPSVLPAGGNGGPLSHQGELQYQHLLWTHSQPAGSGAFFGFFPKSQH